MNKLLLLAVAGLISITLQSLAATAPELPSTIAYQDSTDKKNANPKDAFKNVFETETSNGINISKLNPKAVSFVEDYMEIHSARLNRMKGWGKPYFDMIGGVFTQHGLPVELKYLSVIESDLKTSAVSWAGAVGPWQFMPETARGFGLVVNRKRDDRRDYRKSTHAAAKYLTNLYGIYNDWLLVVAAYNCGAGNVNAAIRKSGSRNFWDMQYYLPTESRNHVKKFIATHYIMEGAGGMTTLTKKETENLSVPAAVTTDPSLSAETISGKYTAQAITGIIQMNITDFNNLNPNFDRTIAANGSYELRLPAEKMTLFQASKPQILEESIKIMLGTAGR
jgi:membrane-bound lytic murein transglycosylase D